MVVEMVRETRHGAWRGGMPYFNLPAYAARVQRTRAYGGERGMAIAKGVELEGVRAQEARWGAVLVFTRAPQGIMGSSRRNT